MVQFTYDGTYIGLLTCIFEIFERKCQGTIVSRDKMDALIFHENIIVYSDREKAMRVLHGLKKKISEGMVANIYCCYLSELKGIENTILQFIQYVFSRNEYIERDYGNSSVLEITQTARKVGREKHRFEAFVRFESMGEKFFYASIDPDYNVLPIIVPHFKRRYADQHWIIYDTKRKYGVYYDRITEQVSESAIDFNSDSTDLAPSAILFDPDEELYRELWKNYFRSVNIPIRKNTKLHLQHVPKRYWKYLVEKE